jgi:two-component system phosphate regulon sensor histidine kinase PhoR
MHKNRYKYVSIVSVAAVLLLLALYMWMTYRSVTKDIEERAGAQLTWAMFYESYTRADLVTEEDTLNLPETRGNLSLASSVEGMNDALSRRYHSEISLDSVAMYVDSLLSVAGINRDVTIQEVRSKERRNKVGSGETE